MVSGPASRPAVVSLSRSSVISVRWPLGWRSGWSWGGVSGLERGLAVGFVAGFELVVPGAVDAVAGGDLGGVCRSTSRAVRTRRALDMPGLQHRCAVAGVLPELCRCLERSITDVLTERTAGAPQRL